MCRKVKSLDTLRKEKMAIKAKLWKEELLALCLYTVQSLRVPHSRPASQSPITFSTNTISLARIHIQ
jgi:hypothetical protein